jgi:hypothetical protein
MTDIDTVRNYIEQALNAMTPWQRFMSDLRPYLLGGVLQYRDPAPGTFTTMYDPNDLITGHQVFPVVCGQCFDHARDVVREGMVEVVMDDTGDDYQTACETLDPVAVRENALEYLAGLEAPCDELHPVGHPLDEIGHVISMAQQQGRDDGASVLVEIIHLCSTALKDYHIAR